MKTKEILEQLPTSCGVYKFFDKENKLLYIGKASNLKQRVSSYFHDNHVDRPHIIPMIPLIEDIKFIQTVNEVEALILESALIKKYQPKFNIDLKDDKSFGWIFISTKADIPQVKIVRSIKKADYKGGRLFGPYPHGIVIKRVYKYLRMIFPFCNCKNDREELLYHQIGLCPGPIIGKISKEDYKKSINKLIDFLSGRRVSPIRALSKRLDLLIKEQRFEEAQKISEKIKDLQYITQRIDIDHLSNEQDYRIKRESTLKKSNEMLAKELKLERINRIECYDISNIGGDFSYGSMVVANDGIINTSGYRAFKIKTVEGANDYASLNEVLSRRIIHIDNNSKDQSLNTKPDIILIDGGKGQVKAVADIVPKDIILMGISKGRKFARAGRKKSNQYWSRQGELITIKSDFVLVNLRDEAHRFAIKFYRQGHNKSLQNDK